MRPGFRNRWLFVSTTACSALALALTGCGGAEEQPEQPAPTLAPAVGEFLLTETEEVTAALEAGELQIARDEALELRQFVEERIAEGQIPRPLRRPLLAAVDRMLASIEVPPAPPPPPPEEEQPPEEADCEELESMKDALEEQRDALDKDDPARQVVEDQLEVVSDQLKECKKEKGGDGEGENGGDD